MDVRFFYGGLERSTLSLVEPPLAIPKSIVLPVMDDYVSLPMKVREMVMWAYDEGYDFLFKLDDDCSFSLSRFIASDFASWDYVGCETRGMTADREVAYASGAGYCLSRKSMEVVQDMVIEGWAEDKEVGRALLEGGITLHHDSRYYSCSCSMCIHQIGKDYIVVHEQQGKI